MNKLLDLFGVKSHEELMEYIKTHPEDERVIDLKAVFLKMGIDLDKETKSE